MPNQMRFTEGFKGLETKGISPLHKFSSQSGAFCNHSVSFLFCWSLGESWSHDSHCHVKSGNAWIHPRTQSSQSQDPQKRGILKETTNWQRCLFPQIFFQQLPLNTTDWIILGIWGRHCLQNSVISQCSVFLFFFLYFFFFSLFFCLFLVCQSN